MNKNILIITLAVLLFLFAALIFVNRNLYNYTYDTQCQRTFVPDMDNRQDYIVNGPVGLKPGSYVLKLKLSAQGNGNGIFLIDGNEEVFFYADLPDGTVDPSFAFTIEGSARQVRIGIRYAAEGTSIQMDWITISAEHVLYRESLLRHLTLSVLLILFALWAWLRLCDPDLLWKIFPPFAKRENELALLFLIILTAASCWPILNGRVYIHGDDMFFHATRIRGMADSLQAGYFPVRDQLYWLHNYGYGVGFYYPDVFLYFPALLVVLGFNLLTAYNIFLIACTFFSIASVWYAGLRISRNRVAAAASAILMAFAAYRLINIYYRAAIGEVQAAMFFPLIVLGLYEIFHGKPEKWPFFAAGFLGIYCCHIISLAIAALLTAFFLLTQIKKIRQDKKIVLALIQSVLTVVGIGAFFWLPMMEQTLTNPGLKVNSLMTDNHYLNRLNYAFPIQNIFARFKAWDWMWQAGTVYPGWTILLTALMAVMVWKKRDKTVRTADFMLIFSIPVLWMCTRAFPWEWKIFLPFVARIQFAYRMLLPVTVMLSLCGGIYFIALVRNRKPYLWLTILALFCFFTTANPILKESAQNRSVEKRIFVMQDNRVSGEEYLPLGLDKDYPGKNADTVRLAEKDVPLTITAHDRQGLSFRFSYEIPEGSGEVHFSVPLIYYTGFKGELRTKDGIIIHSKITWDDRGLVSLSNHNISNGTINITYSKTIPQVLGEYITLISLCYIVIRYKFHFTQKKITFLNKE